MEKIIGTIVFLLIYGVFHILSHIAKQAEEKKKQEAAMRQQKVAAARQQQDAAGRTGAKKKFRQLEQLLSKNDEALDSFVTAESVPTPLRRESAFAEPVGGMPPSQAADRSASLKPFSDYPNPVAQGIMAMMTTPQTMQQAVILSEIFNRPKYE